MQPHNLPMAMIGACLLWFGWFGFNAGSALGANETAALAFFNTLLATAGGVLAWTAMEWFYKGKPSLLGAISGMVAGLVGITPAAGLRSEERRGGQACVSTCRFRWLRQP